jgi:hypothetical protein
VLNDAEQGALYVELGVSPPASKDVWSGDPYVWELQGWVKQMPGSALHAMRLQWPAKDGWQLVRVAGDLQVPRLVDAAMACGLSRTTYIFGGVANRGSGESSQYVPTASLVKVALLGDGRNGYQAQAVALRPRGKGPSARSGHVLLYLAPPQVQHLGMPEGALLLHGGTNSADVEFGPGSWRPYQYTGTSVSDRVRNSSQAGQQKPLHAYDDTWLFDLARNRWEQLPGSRTPIPLVWHSGTVRATDAGHQVVLYGGTTILEQNGQKQAAGVSGIMLLDLSARNLKWQTVPVDSTQAGTRASGAEYPNSGICTVPGTPNLLLRRQEVSMRHAVCAAVAVI